MHIHCVLPGSLWANPWTIPSSASNLAAIRSRLRLEHGHAAEDEVLFTGVSDRAGIVEVEQMHRAGLQVGGTRKCSRVNPKGSTDRRGSPPNRNSILTDPRQGCQPSNELAV